MPQRRARPTSKNDGIGRIGGKGGNGRTSGWRRAPAPPATPAPAAAPNDYTNPDTWLCRPGRTDACNVDLDATVIHADGSMKVERFHADPNAPIDCFYVYPTVSRQRTPNADMTIEAAETNVVLHQFEIGRAHV